MGKGLGYGKKLYGNWVKEVSLVFQAARDIKALSSFPADIKGHTTLLSVRSFHCYSDQYPSQSRIITITNVIIPTHCCGILLCKLALTSCIKAATLKIFPSWKEFWGILKIKELQSLEMWNKTRICRRGSAVRQRNSYWFSSGIFHQLLGRFICFPDYKRCLTRWVSQEIDVGTFWG